MKKLMIVLALLASFQVANAQAGPAAAKKAQELGIPYFTTTLASSRWKSLDQINRAGEIAEKSVQCHYWAQNWRKGGLYERRNQLLKEFNFYNQQYCGCEFSIRDKSIENKEK